VDPGKYRHQKLSRGAVMSDNISLADWLASREHRSLPDFLDLPEGHNEVRNADGLPLDGLRRYDILALQVMARSRGGPIPRHLMPEIGRLYRHGIIGRFAAKATTCIS
jgi:hypothetical protein